MKRIFLFLPAALLLTISCPAPVMAQTPAKAWADKNISFRDRVVNDIKILDDRFYLATRSELYQSDDGEGRWDSVFTLPHSSNEINCISASRAKEVYIGTKKGLFKSGCGNRTWRNTFRTIMPHGNDISAIAVSDLNPAQILIGTGSGVFLSEDSGEGWMNISGALKDKEVRSVAINHAGFYAGGESGLFFTNDKGGHWDRILVKGTTKETGAEEDPETQPEDLSPDEGVAFIAMNDSNIYAAVGKVIYYSGMGKNEWSTLPDSGLKGYVNFILPSKTTSKVYAGTTRGAYEYLEESGRWEGLTAGIPNANVNRLSFESSEEKTLWAATDKGLFKLETTRLVVERRSEVEGQIKDVFVMMDNEPAFQELAQAAIRYADVSPDKIKKWHMESRFKALMPKLSIGSGKNKSNTSEIYTSATKDYIVVGPDRISDSFDVSLSWELGNLIWSDDQTNIDVRSRLMVQLRNDILDDLRRAFYERKRLRLELAVNPPPDIRAKFEKELRLQELGSTIDDLTGNYLSSKIQDLRREGGAY